MKPDETGPSRPPANISTVKQPRPIASVSGSQASLSSSSADFPRPARFTEDLETHHVIPSEYTRGPPRRSSSIRALKALRRMPSVYRKRGPPPGPFSGGVYLGESALSLVSQQPQPHTPSSGSFELRPIPPLLESFSSLQSVRGQTVKEEGQLYSPGLPPCAQSSKGTSVQANAGSAASQSSQTAQPPQPHQPLQPPRPSERRPSITCQMFERIKGAFRRGYN